MWKEQKPDLDIKENHDSGVEKQSAPEKTQKEVKTGADSYYQKFLLDHQKPKKELSEAEKEKLFLEEVEEMDENTAMCPVESDCVDEPVYTEEELKEIEEDDAGYVNDKVLDYDNELDTNNNTYRETGKHTNAIHWGDPAEGEIKKEILPAGKVLSRWGSEEGTFMSDVNVDYEKLELPIIKEKNTQSLYEVITPFPVETSKVAKQPWNKKEGEEQDSDEKSEPVLQYDTPISVKDLVEEGYLRKL